MSMENRKPCIIFAGCEMELVLPDELTLLEHGAVICADRGLEFCHRAGLKADIAIGDFDSLDKSHLKIAEEAGTKIMQYPADKEETDFELALKAAYRLGNPSCSVYGALGGRLDHELANIYLMKRFNEMGMHISFIGRRYSVDIMNDKTPYIADGKAGFTLSVIPLADAVVGMRISGTKFELHGDDMVCGSSRGVSNLITDDHVEISCLAGEAIIVLNNPGGVS